jgi:subtilisin family serine protease
MAHQISNFQFDPPWGLDRIDQEDLPLDGVFGYEGMGSGVDLFILDTGMLRTHSQFAPISRTSCVFDAYNTGCRDDNGHGTHVAGIAGSALYGVAKNVTLKAMRVCSSSGICLSDNLVDALDNVAGWTGKRVVNLSLAGYFDPAFEDAAQGAAASGAVIVLAAGNFGIDACRQMANSNASISVGAVDDTDKRWSQSSYGSCVDIWAPGKDILSTWRTDNNATNVLTGTSMASPHVAGAAALLLEEGIAPEDVLSTLQARAISGTLTNLQEGSLNLLLHLTLAPSSMPSGTPSSEPSQGPSTSLSPSQQPSTWPSSSPTSSLQPSTTPSLSHQPSLRPSMSPSFEPSFTPSHQPSKSLPSCPANRIGTLCFCSSRCCPGYRCKDRRLLRAFMGRCKAY